MAMAAGAMRRVRVYFCSETLSELARIVGEILQEASPTMAFYVGPPGPHRKTTIAVVRPSGQIAGYAKFAVRDGSREKLRHEVTVLTDLASRDALEDRIPRVLGRFNWRGGEGAVLTAGPSRSAGIQPTDMHLGFLESLHRETFVSAAVSGIEWWRSTRSVLKRFESRLPQDWIRRYESLETFLVRRLGDSSIPMSRAHRDFSPWNCRVGNSGLFVFDWEFSRPSMPPLYDLFHYTSGPSALLGRRPKPTDHARRLLERLWPEGLELERELRVAYLADASLHYVEARLDATDMGGNVFRDWLGRQIDRSLN
jgi:hypothetical protein